MKLSRLNHTGVTTQPKPLPGGEGHFESLASKRGWGFGAVSSAQRRTPTPLRLGDKSPSLTAPPLRVGGLLPLVQVASKHYNDLIM